MVGVILLHRYASIGLGNLPSEAGGNPPLQPALPGLWNPPAQYTGGYVTHYVVDPL